jgi:hypothetical protein
MRFNKVRCVVAKNHLAFAIRALEVFHYYNRLRLLLNYHNCYLAYSTLWQAAFSNTKLLLITIVIFHCTCPDLSQFDHGHVSLCYINQYHPHTH